METPPRQPCHQEAEVHPAGLIWTEERKAQAMATARTFLGTKHVNRLCLPGVGVDCVNLVTAVLAGAGIAPKATLPYYDERLGSLRKRNVIEDIITTHLHARRVEEGEAPHFGDIVICRCGRQTNHVGIMLEIPPPCLALFHVPAMGFASAEPWEVWKPRAQSLLRITRTGYRADPSKLTWQAVRGMADSEE